MLSGKSLNTFFTLIMKNWYSNNREKVLNKYQLALRERAIEQAKVEIALAGKKVVDYDQDQLEIIVKAQEDKIKGRYKYGALAVVMLALGIY